MPALHDPKAHKTPIQQLSKFINVMLRGKEANGKWISTYERITVFKKQMDQRLRSGGARVYDFRLFDLVLGNEKPSKSKIQSSYGDFLSMAFDFVNKLGMKKNKKELNIRFLSPRFMPVMPDKMEANERILSPSIMSFYRDDSPDSIASLPKLLEDSGMTEKDRKAVIEMVMDVSGARHAVEMGLDFLEQTNFFGLEDKFFEATERISGIFTNLEKSFNKQQSKELEKDGFTFLEVPQIKKVLNSHGGV
ncbi:unnamed protein product [Gongylonema pulchrum]|uniref:DUF935 family protein n=1 Tax=Gongylonema pulchrum TaxID=637853 RepID=A0A183CWC9_9BILA|nr:unnamed protein product [Gongylonema pulchrum]